MTATPLESLQQGNWFKLICGASFQHLPAVRTLAFLYTLAGADCVDVAADQAVIQAAREGIQAAIAWHNRDRPSHKTAPWLMVSLNAGADPHFRKAAFDPQHCPPDCDRPCETVCPAQAIAGEVLKERCYGCGRCVPICPFERIHTYEQPASVAAVLPLIQQGWVQAIEIHTHCGQQAAVTERLNQLAPQIHQLQGLAISCPDADGVVDYLVALQCQLQDLACPIIWQTDGRPMSGDIGAGATRATLKFAEKIVRSPLPGYVQLAGGTNDSTAAKAREIGLMRSESDTDRWIAGIAYGSYARKLLLPIQNALEAQLQTTYCIEDYPDLLTAGYQLASQLVGSVKGPQTVHVIEPSSLVDALEN